MTTYTPHPTNPVHCCVCLQAGRVRRAAVILDGYLVCDKHWTATQQTGRTAAQLLEAARRHHHQKGEAT